MNAPLRWGLALAAVGTLGFFAGRHFGRDEPEFSWEACDKVGALKDDAGVR